MCCLRQMVVSAVVQVLLIFVTIGSARADHPDGYADGVILLSVTAQAGQSLTENNDPTYIPEYNQAYADFKLKFKVKVLEPGDYEFGIRITPQEDRGSSRQFEFRLVQALPPGQMELELPITISDFTRQQGLLWSIVPGHSSKVEIVVSRKITAAEIEERESINLSDQIEGLRKHGAREIDLDVLNVPRNRPIEKFVSRQSFVISMGPVERKMARSRK